MKHIVVIGSYNIGLTVLGKRIPRPGETVTGHRFTAGPGGKGSNQAIAARRLGGRVTLVARVGNDLFGRDALKLFRREKLPARYVAIDEKQATGAGVIFVDEAGQNAIGVALGANLALNCGDISRAAELFEPGAILLMQLESPVSVLREAARRARRAGMTVILNPAPAPEHPLDAGFLALCDYLTPNETEASEMSGVNVRDARSAERAARKLLAMGPRHVLITLGEAGSLLVTKEGAVPAPAPKVRVADTTGAGDAFNGAFAYALAADMAPPEAVKFATSVGAYSVGHIGVIDGLPTMKQLGRMLDSTIHKPGSFCDSDRGMVREARADD
jgi:ribokinase